MEKIKIYFASPFFNDEQVEREERLKAKLRKLGFEVWSPKEKCVCPPDATHMQRLQVFNDNLDGMQNSKIIFVVTDGKDMGTIWEAGYFYGMRERNAKIPGRKIIYYCETLGDNLFNLMLAQSGDYVITDEKEITKKLIQGISKGEITNEYEGKIE